MTPEAIEFFHDNLLVPFFEHDLTRPHNKPLIENTFVNLVKIFSDKRINPATSKNKVWQTFKGSYRIRPEKLARRTLCALIIKNNLVCNSGEEGIGILGRIKKTLEVNLGLKVADLGDFEEFFFKMVDCLLKDIGRSLDSKRQLEPNQNEIRSRHILL